MAFGEIESSYAPDGWIPGYFVTHWSSPTTMVCPSEPQSLEGPSTWAQARYQRPACNTAASLNSS